MKFIKYVVSLVTSRKCRQKKIQYALLSEKKKKFIYIADWIYENMASVSVYRSYAKCVLGTKTLTLPTQDNG